MDRGDKKFTILDLNSEVEYIQSMTEKGKILVDVDDKSHLFKDGDSFKSSVVIEFWKEKPLNSVYYENQGLKLVKELKGSKGYWLYFLGPYNENLNIRKDDYSDLVDTIKSRYEIFWTIIPMTLALFGIYMYIKSSNPLFFILIIVPIILIFYLRNIKDKFNNNKN